MKKGLISVVLILLCLVFTGCFRGDIKVNINEDGSCDFNYKMVVVQIPGTVDMMQSQIKDLEKKQFRIEKFIEGDMIGFKAYKHFNNVTELSDFKMFNGSAPGVQGIVLNKGWFYDSYKVSILNDISLNEGKPLTNFDQAMLAQMSMKVTMTFPTKPETSNANNVFNDGKTLEWVLSFTKENHLEATAKFWNYGNIVITVLIPLVLIVGLFVQRRKYYAGDGQMPKLLAIHPVIAGCIAVVIISGAGVGYYSMSQTKSKPVQQPQQQSSTQTEKKAMENNTQQVGQSTPAAVPATTAQVPAVNASTSPLRGKWLYQGSPNANSPVSSMSAMVVASGNQLNLNFGMNYYKVQAKATAKAEMVDNANASFSYTDGNGNHGNGSMRIQGGKLIIEVEGTNSVGGGIVPGKYSLDRWVD